MQDQRRRQARLGSDGALGQGTEIIDEHPDPPVGARHRHPQGRSEGDADHADPAGIDLGPSRHERHRIPHGLQPGQEVLKQGREGGAPLPRPVEVMDEVNPVAGRRDRAGALDVLPVVAQAVSPVQHEHGRDGAPPPAPKPSTAIL